MYQTFTRNSAFNELLRAAQMSHRWIIRTCNRSFDVIYVIKNIFQSFEISWFVCMFVCCTENIGKTSIYRFQRIVTRLQIGFSDGLWASMLNTKLKWFPLRKVKIALTHCIHGMIFDEIVSSKANGTYILVMLLMVFFFKSICSEAKDNWLLRPSQQLIKNRICKRVNMQNRKQQTIKKPTTLLQHAKIVWKTINRRRKWRLFVECLCMWAGMCIYVCVCVTERQNDQWSRACTSTMSILTFTNVLLALLPICPFSFRISSNLI